MDHNCVKAVRWCTSQLRLQAPVAVDCAGQSERLSRRDRLRHDLCVSAMRERVSSARALLTLESLSCFPRSHMAR